MTRIVFMGSPTEVLAPLRAILERGPAMGAELVGVVSQPARPVGRGAQLADPPVAAFSKEKGIKTFQPQSSKSPLFLEELRALQPDIIVTAAYGQILSDEFLAIPRRGTINIHPSLLPNYRGATPVPAALLEGLKTTGVSILFTVKRLDAGNIILQKSFDIGSEETAGELTARLFFESSSMLIGALELLRDQSDFQGTPQDHEKATFCTKIIKEMGEVDWSQNSVDIHNRFRAFQPWPGSYTYLKGRSVAITQMTVSQDQVVQGKSGSFIYDRPTKAIIVYCGKGSVNLKRLRPAGGKDMDAASFWNGLKDRDSDLVFGKQDIGVTLSGC
jgi:methionyl-tRNA formyltransferase